MGKLSTKRIVASCVIALFCGVLFPFMLAFAPFLVLMPMILALLYVWAGLWPVTVAVGAALASLVFLSMQLGSPLFLALGVPAALLPGIYVVVLLRRRVKFFQALMHSIVAQILGLALALVAARLLAGADLVGALLNWFVAWVDAQPLPDTQSWLLTLGRMGLFGAGTGVDFSLPLMTLDQQNMLVGLWVDMADRSLRLNMPSTLLSSGVISGILCYLLAARSCARRGVEPRVDYVHLYDWRLPKSMIIGLPACTLICVIALQFGATGAESARVALLNLCYTAFAIQGAGALTRRLRQTGASSGRRGLLALFLLVFARWLLSAMGLYSALFGSRGLISETIRKHNENHPGGDGEL